MSSETSTEAGGFRAWHFFLLAGIVAAAAAVLLAPQASALEVLLLTLSVWAAGLAGLAMHRMLAPLAQPETDMGGALGAGTRAALEHEKTMVLRSIKELEFDRAMGKVAAADFDDMVARLRARAIALLGQLDAGDTSGYLDLIERELRARLASRRAGGDADAESGAQGKGPDEVGPGAEPDEGLGQGPDERPGETIDERSEDLPAAPMERAGRRSCPCCDTANEQDARFCKQCGQALESGEPPPRAAEGTDA